MSRARDVANLGSDTTNLEDISSAYAAGALSNRNKIINGNFEVWQRGTSFSGVNSPRYTADRWQVYGASSTTVDVTRQSFAAGQTEVEGNPQYFIRIDNTPDPDTTWMETLQRIEDVTYFSGVTVTLSFWIKSNRNISNQNYFGFFQNFGSGGSTAVGTNSSNFDITTSWQKKTLTVTLPSISGKTIGSGNYLEIHLLQTSPIQADTYYDIAQVQLEVGSVATPFEHRSYGQELALCQRYFQTFVNPLFVGVVPNNTARVYDAGIIFQPQMRSTPTASISNTGSSNGQGVNDGQNTAYITSLLSTGGTKYGMELNFNISADLTDYRIASFSGGGSATNQTTYNFDAEL